jgi:solute carrier family 25 phosphate transporter 3
MPKMISQEGFGNLYASIGPLWARQVPYTIIKFVAFERIAEFFYKYIEKSFGKKKSDLSKVEQMGVIFSAGYIAGVLCGAVSHPADTMVSKINKLKMSGGIGQKMGVIYYGTKEAPGIGFAGLWKGFGPRVFMIGTLTGLQWFIYDTVKVTFGIPTTGSAPPAKTEAPKVEAKKEKEAPKKEAAPKKEEPKAAAPAAAPKKEEPKAAEPKKEEPKHAAPAEPKKDAAPANKH